MSRRRKILIAVGIVLGVAILIPVIRHYQLRVAVANYIAELKAKGEPMDLAQVIPPPVPPEQNGVPFITNALANLKYGSNTPPAMRGVTFGKAMIGWQQSAINDFGVTNSWEDLGQEIAAAKNDLNSFQKLTNHPALDFNLNYDGGFDLLLTSLAPLKRSAQWLSASALYNLREGNTTVACANAREILSIVNGESDERTLISQLVRIAIASIDINVSWEILQSTNVSDGDLLQL